MSTGRVRLARLPATTDRNPYQRLLYGHLRRYAIDLVGDATLTAEWLRANRSGVDVLHVHWRLDRVAARATGPASRVAWAPERAKETAAQVGADLDLAVDLGYRIVWTVHDADVLGHEPTIDALVGVELGRVAHVVTAHNQVAIDHVVGLGIVEAARTVLVPFPHYGDAHPDGRRPTRSDLGIAGDATVVLAFGDQRGDKDLHLLLDAFDLIGRDDLVMVIAGPHPDEPELARLNERVEGDPRIRLLGEIPDAEVVALHRACDLTVLPRGTEKTPSSLVLSLSLGVPAVAADLPGIHEHAGEGFVPFRPGDASSLAAAIDRVAADPDQARRVAAAGRAHVRRVSWDDTARATALAVHRACETCTTGSR
jgi:glycosyltransferase involved in cell wall biosynthesis